MSRQACIARPSWPVTTGCNGKYQHSSGFRVNEAARSNKRPYTIISILGLLIVRYKLAVLLIKFAKPVIHFHILPITFRANYHDIFGLSIVIFPDWQENR